MKTENRQRAFIVTLMGHVWFDTTVAVLAETEEEAKSQALQASHWDPALWCSDYRFQEDPVVSTIDEETDWSELEYADQTQLLPEGFLHLKRENGRDEKVDVES